MMIMTIMVIKTEILMMIRMNMTTMVPIKIITAANIMLMKDNFKSDIDNHDGYNIKGDVDNIHYEDDNKNECSDAD